MSYFIHMSSHGCIMGSEGWEEAEDTAPGSSFHWEKKLPKWVYQMCVWLVFHKFHEEKDGQEQQSRKIPPEPVGPGDWEQQPENRSVKTQMKTRGSLGWNQLDTSSNWCIKNICLMFIWKRYLMFMQKRTILVPFVVCSRTFAWLEIWANIWFGA